MKIDPDLVRHRPSCTRTAVGAPFTGHRGDVLVQCFTCGYLTVLPAQANLNYTHGAPTFTAAAYVCPEHPETVVNAHGNGCDRCATRRQRNRQPTRRRR